MMRASLSEMFGHTNRAAAEVAAAAGVTTKEPVDMTSSRLQSELYRMWLVRDLNALTVNQSRPHIKRYVCALFYRAPP